MAGMMTGIGQVGQQLAQLKPQWGRNQEAESKIRSMLIWAQQLLSETLCDLWDADCLLFSYSKVINNF